MRGIEGSQADKERLGVSVQNEEKNWPPRHQVTKIHKEKIGAPWCLRAFVARV